MKSCLKILLVSVFLPFSAHATSQANTGITQASARAFFTHVNSAQDKPLEQYTKIVSDSFTDDATFELHDTLYMQGMEPQKTDQSLGKSEYLTNLKSGYDMLQGAKIKYDITGIQISSDKKSATVKDSTSVANKINSPGGNGPLNFKSTATCTNDIKLVSADKIQVSKTVCNSITHATP